MLTPQKWEVIAGRYRLVREIARGGMGSVWEGQDNKLKRKVAIKLVASDLHDEENTEAAHTQFEREAMAVAQLQSPHVVQIFDYGVERECPFIVMELLEGEDLRSRLHRSKRLSLDMAGIILVQTAKALSVAHAAGIVHRDLKPGNIFMVRAAEEEIVKVLDFGVAMQAADLLEQQGETPILGTPQFMSPEQARGLPDLDHRADLWSLGVIIYKGLTGRLPFTGGNPTEVIVRVCTADAEPVSRLAPDLPRELDAFFEKALARDRRLRFSSAREMAMAFSRISPITFTTLSMPDPVAIEQAIAAARASAAQAVEADDEAATLAVDPATIARMEDDSMDDLKTSVVIPTSAMIPAPTPPPRRSHLTSSSPPPTVDDFLADELLVSDDSDALTVALDLEEDFPTSVPPGKNSAPVLLERTSSDDHLPSDTPPAVVGKSRRSPVVQPTEDGKLKPGTRNTLLMAAAAALFGVGVAVIGSQMKSETVVVEGKAASPATTSTTTTAQPQSAASSEEQDIATSPSAEATADKSAAPSPAAAAPPRPPRAPVDPIPVPVAKPERLPEPAPEPAPAPAPPEPVQPAPAPAPEPPPAPKPAPDDPFAERL